MICKRCGKIDKSKTSFVQDTVLYVCKDCKKTKPVAIRCAECGKVFPEAKFELKINELCSDCSSKSLSNVKESRRKFNNVYNDMTRKGDITCVICSRFSDKIFCSDCEENYGFKVKGKTIEVYTIKAVKLFEGYCENNPRTVNTFNAKIIKRDIKIKKLLKDE